MCEKSISGQSDWCTWLADWSKVISGVTTDGKGGGGALQFPCVVTVGPEGKKLPINKIQLKLRKETAPSPTCNSLTFQISHPFNTRKRMWCIIVMLINLMLLQSIKFVFLFLLDFFVSIEDCGYTQWFLTYSVFALLLTGCNRHTFMQYLLETVVLCVLSLKMPYCVPLYYSSLYNIHITTRKMWVWLDSAPNLLSIMLSIKCQFACQHTALSLVLKDSKKINNLFSFGC